MKMPKICKLLQNVYPWSNVILDTN